MGVQPEGPGSQWGPGVDQSGEGGCGFGMNVGRSNFQGPGGWIQYGGEVDSVCLWVYSFSKLP